MEPAENTTFLKPVTRVVDILANIGGYACSLILVVMALCNTIEPFSRTVLGVGTKWVTEFSMYGLVFVSLLGASYVEKYNAHIRVDVFSSIIPKKLNKLLEVLIYLWSTAFLLFFLKASVGHVRLAYINETISMTILRIPMWIPYSVMLIGILLLLLQFANKLAIKIMELVLINKESNTKNDPISFKGAFTFILILVVIIIGVIMFFQGSGNVRIVGFLMLLFGFLFSGMPVFVALFSIGCLGFFLFNGFDIAGSQLATLTYSSLESFPLCALPLFVFAGGLFSASGMVDNLFSFCEAWLERLPGCLAMATIASCAVFAALSGSSVATAASVGMIAIPAMVKRGYDPGLACGSVIAAGTLGIMIPPSNQFIIYGVLTDTSVGRLFMAGVIPGIFITLIFMLYIYLKCKNDPRYKSKGNVTLREKWQLTKKSALVLIAPLIILGGIYTGIFTPTESAAIAVLYGLFLCFLTKKITFKSLFKILADSSRTATMVLVIIAGASAFGGLVILLQIAQKITAFAVTSDIPNFMIIIAILILTLILGTLVDGIALTMIVVPICFPAIAAMNYDLIWFGVLFCVGVEIGLITPPVGMTLYTVKGISGIDFRTIIRGSIPFMVAMLICLIAIGVFQDLSLWLPSVMMGK